MISARERERERGGIQGRSGKTEWKRKESIWRTAFTALLFSEGQYKREGARERIFSSILWQGKVRLFLTDVYWRLKWCNTWSSFASEHKWFTVLSEQCLMSSSRCKNMTPCTHIQPFNTGRKPQPLNTSGSLQGPTRSDPTEEYQPNALFQIQTMFFKVTAWPKISIVIYFKPV